MTAISAAGYYDPPDVGESVLVTDTPVGPRCGAEVIAIGPRRIHVRMYATGNEYAVDPNNIDRERIRCGAPLIIVPCGKTKLDRPAPARDLYTGSYFTAAYRMACYWSVPSRVLILSGLHGFVRPDTVLAPYEQRIDQPGAITVDELREQAKSIDTFDRSPMIFAGAVYADRVRSVWSDAYCPGPLSNARGIGDHLRFFSVAPSPDGQRQLLAEDLDGAA